VDAALRRQIVDYFQRRTDALAVYLFGSTARREDRGGSDVDLAVLFAEAPPRTLDGPRFAIAAELEPIVGREIDLIVLNDAPVDLRMRILRDGDVLIDRDRAARIAFEVQTRNEYWDFEPALALYRSPRGSR
jgi:uncharacterized protein